MGAFVMILGYIFMGIAVFNISKKLFEIYPFGIPCGRFWWSKYLPILGFGLLLMAAGEPLFVFLPGFVLIIASIFFLPKSSKDIDKKINP